MKALKIPASMMVAALLFVVAAHAQTYTLLHTWPINPGNTSGIVPPGLMSQGRDGELYSTISNGGLFNGGSGTAFKITTAGTLTTIYNFCALAQCPDGSVPRGGLTLGTDGNLYGSTQNGGKIGGGTVFRLTPAGVLTTMWSFGTLPGDADGGAPNYAPFQGQDGNFYGSSNEIYAGDGGLIYKVTSAGKFTVLGDFNFTNGWVPNLPTQGTDGNFYGTTQIGQIKGTSCGLHGCGVVYKMSPGGALSVLHNFSGYVSATVYDGSIPYGALVQGNDGYFYGVTNTGGQFNQGTIFKISASGKSYIILHSFENDFTIAAGDNPFIGLTMGSDGNFYGTAKAGKYGAGVIYQITPAGVYTPLYNFCAVSHCPDGFNPATMMTQHTNGKFYGNTVGNSLGGSYFYELDTGLGPFVSPLTQSGKAGATVEILGTGLTGASSVQFGTGFAAFTVVSDTYMTAVIPSSGTVGNITVSTPSGTLSSVRPFKVLPVVKSFTPTSGLPGSSVTITGTNLLGATKVTFGGAAAAFIVNSDTQITATVPATGKTGKIAVTTPGGVATSAASFTVT